MENLSCRAEPSIPGNDMYESPSNMGVSIGLPTEMNTVISFLFRTPNDIKKQNKKTTRSPRDVTLTKYSSLDFYHTPHPGAAQVLKCFIAIFFGLVFQVEATITRPSGNWAHCLFKPE